MTVFFVVWVLLPIRQVLKQHGAAFDDISPGGFEIASVPRVGHIARTIGIVQQ
jgi:hypothetical protein